ncbi:hypothetical protein N7504_004346 [Penicillium tannophilum]|nr:hypothetical protein N7504_004346 [Penicillium tannophilum]
MARSFTKMMLMGILCFNAAPMALAEELEPAPPHMTEAPGVNNLHTRVEMTAWQNWVVAGGAGLAGIGTFASGIAAFITAKSSSASCATTILNVYSKRDEEPIGVDALALNLRDQGYAQSGDWVFHENGNKTFDGYFTNGELRFNDLYVAGNYSGGTLAYENTTDSLAKRVTYSSSKLAFEYHSRKGVCKTRLTKAQLKEAADLQLNYMSSAADKCSCWTYTGGHGWYGEVKLMEVYDGDDYSAKCYNKACNAD